MSDFLRTFTGRTIDDIPLAEYLAGGAASATFKTTFSGQPAVIKLFASDSADAQLAHLQLTEKLSHPHLLRTLSTGRTELDGTPLVYLVTEFAEENLAQVLPERALTAPEAGEVLRSTLDALSYLHSQGLVHADLKPANIMAIGDRLKLSVDGARRIGEPLDRELGAHDAPEAPQKLSAASDIWSLGITLVEVLTQQRPPASSSDATGPAVPESVPAPFREIAHHCLLRTPELRWSIADISAKLNPKAPAPPTATARIDPAPLPIPPARAGSKRPFILLAIVAAIVIAIVLFSRTSENKTPVPASTESQSPAPQPAPAPQAATTEEPAPETTPATSTKVEHPAPTQHVAEEPATGNEDDSDTPEPATSTASSPGVVHQVMPQVLPRAQNSIHGKVRVKLKVEVDSSGNVVDSSFVSRGPSNYFARVAEDAARRWKFEPSSTEARDWDIEFDFRRGGTQVRSKPAH